VTSVRFSPDGRHLLTACRDGAARLGIARGSVADPGVVARTGRSRGRGRLDDTDIARRIEDWVMPRAPERPETSDATDPYTRWANWFFADRAKRTISAASPITVQRDLEDEK
jgi:hypothetical protein